MSLSLGVLKETAVGERRVALVPSLIPQLQKWGFDVLVEKGAGVAAGYPDADYQARGAQLVSRSSAAQADVVFVVRRPEEDLRLKSSAILIGMLDPWEPHPFFTKMQKKKATLFSLELIPRTTRAQSMDVLSSQANLAGYKAVLVAAEASMKMFPMMMTAAGTITASRVFVLGAGVAGLQAIATARRLGAVVYGYDVRPAVKEQVESLGAKFVELNLESAEGAGGYAKAMDEAYYQKQRQLLAEVIKDMDVVISTAAIPGKRSPLLITKAAVEGMKGGVIVDLAAERGGNCELSRPNETVVHKGVTILAPTNLPSTLAYNASALFGKNLVNFLGVLMKQDKQTKAYTLTIDSADDIVAATLVLRDGEAASDRVRELLKL